MVTFYNVKWFLIFIILLLSCFFISINHVYYHFSALDYVPPGAGLSLLSLFLIQIGLMVSSASTYLQSKLSLLIVYYISIYVIAIFTNAVQLTPYAPIDNALIHMDHFLGMDLLPVMAYFHAYPRIIEVFVFAYNSIYWQVAFLPTLAVFLTKRENFERFIFLLLLSALWGFLFYYFFPTTGPASHLTSPYFLSEQYYTGVKFLAIHQRIVVSSLAGGLIAMPSFHVIWSCLCLYSLKPISFAFYLCLPLTLLLCISCVALGWHYPIDLVGSFVLLGLCYGIAHLVLRKAPP